MISTYKLERNILTVKISDYVPTEGGVTNCMPFVIGFCQLKKNFVWPSKSLVNFYVYRYAGIQFLTSFH